MNPQATSNVKSVTFTAKVIRANGTVEDLGTIAQYHAKPQMRWYQKLINQLSKLAK